MSKSIQTSNSAPLKVTFPAALDFLSPDIARVEAGGFKLTRNIAYELHSERKETQNSGRLR
jgi:hypothetical protein